MLEMNKIMARAVFELQKKKKIELTQNCCIVMSDF